MNCLICEDGDAVFLRNIDGVDYFECNDCGSLFADPDYIYDIDSKSTIYTEDYWRIECKSARSRSFGSSLNRVAEVFLYSRIPINNFIDIGSGPGYLLDALSVVLPEHSDVFYGIELYPPPDRLRSTHKNYKVGDLSSMGMTFDAGCCIEVIEHLSPSNLNRLISDIARYAAKGSIFYFNSAQPSFVKNVDPDYLDPYNRGHICSYSLSALEKMFSAFGFTLIPLPGRDWGFLVEFGKLDDSSSNFETLMTRVWNPVDSNLNKLNENGFGPFMYSVGVESARCYYEAEMSAQRTRWALSLNEIIESKK